MAKKKILKPKKNTIEYYDAFDVRDYLESKYPGLGKALMEEWVVEHGFGNDSYFKWWIPDNIDDYDTKSKSSIMAFCEEFGYDLDDAVVLWVCW